MLVSSSVSWVESSLLCFFSVQPVLKMKQSMDNQTQHIRIIRFIDISSIHLVLSHFGEDTDGISLGVLLVEEEIEGVFGIGVGSVLQRNGRAVLVVNEHY